MAKIIQGQKYTLSGSGVTSSQTTIPLNSFNLPDGTAIDSGNLATTNYGTLEPGTSREEIISFTGLSGTTLTGVTRGLKFVSPYTEDSSLKSAHAGNAIFVLTNNPQVYQDFVDDSTDQTIGGVKTFSSLPAITAGNPVADNDVARKAYVDSVVAGSFPSNRLVVAGTAGETISDGDLIYFDAVTNNEWMLADSQVVASVENVILGIAQGAGTDGNAITNGVLLIGVDDAQSGMTAGDLMYADDVAGGITTAPAVAAFLTGDTDAQSNYAVWEAITDGSFRITIDGTAYNVDAIDFTGDTDMDDVAATIQAALRAQTSGSETVVWSTDHFVITSGITTSTSEVSVTSTSTGTVGTDISGAGASDWMDCDTGNATATAVAKEVTVGIAKSATELYFYPRNDQQITEDQQDALAGTSGTPSSTNKYVTNDDVADDGTASKIVRLDANQQANINQTPTADGHAASKAYVDSFSIPNNVIGESVDGLNFTYQVNFDTESWAETDINFTPIYGNAGANLNSTTATWQAVTGIVPTNSSSDDNMQWDDLKDMTLQFRAQAKNGLTGDRKAGFSNSPSTNYNDSDGNGEICFSIDGSTLYAKTADAASETLTDISSGITLTDSHLYKIVYTAGTDAKFYVDGTLKATHTTNLPGAIASNANLGFGGSANTEDWRIHNVVITIEL